MGASPACLLVTTLTVRSIWHIHVSFGEEVELNYGVSILSFTEPVLPDCFPGVVVLQCRARSLDDRCSSFLAVLNRHPFCQPNCEILCSSFHDSEHWISSYVCVHLFFFLWRLPLGCLSPLFFLRHLSYWFVLPYKVEKDDLGQLRVLSLCALWLSFHFVYNVFHIHALSFNLSVLFVLIFT